MALAGGIDDPRRVGGLADVAGDVRAALADLRRRLFEDLLAAPGDDHLRPGRRELERRLLAEVGAAARDEDHAPGQRLGREDLRGLWRQGRAGEPGFEPEFMVLETMRIAVNSLPQGAE